MNRFDIVMVRRDSPDKGYPRLQVDTRTEAERIAEILGLDYLVTIIEYSD